MVGGLHSTTELCIARSIYEPRSDLRERPRRTTKASGRLGCAVRVATHCDDWSARALHPGSLVTQGERSARMRCPSRRSLRRLVGSGITPGSPVTQGEQSARMRCPSRRSLRRLVGLGITPRSPVTRGERSARMRCPSRRSLRRLVGSGSVSRVAGHPRRAAGSGSGPGHAGSLRRAVGPGSGLGRCSNFDWSARAMRPGSPIIAA